MKALRTVKASVTRWLLHCVICKKCHKRYKIIIEALDSIITKYLKLEFVDLGAQLFEENLIKKMLFLEDVLSITDSLHNVIWDSFYDNTNNVTEKIY